MTAAPLVSTVMAVYDGAAFIDAAIASVLAQSHATLELIVIDDGSSDDTAARVLSWQARDLRVRLLREPHRGHAHALNAGIAAARGSYIARIDHDDLWYPQRLTVQLDWMERHALDICGSWVRRIGSERGVIRFAQSHEAMRYAALFTCPILDSATLFRGDVLRANPYPPEAFIRQELYQCVTLMSRHRFGTVPKILCKYRFHPTQKTRRFQPIIRRRQDQLTRLHFRTMFPDAEPADVDAFGLVHKGFETKLTGDEIARVECVFRRYLRPDDDEARNQVRMWRRRLFVKQRH